MSSVVGGGVVSTESASVRGEVVGAGDGSSVSDVVVVGAGVIATSVVGGGVSVESATPREEVLGEEVLGAGDGSSAFVVGGAVATAVACDDGAGVKAASVKSNRYSNWHTPSV